MPTSSAGALAPDTVSGNGIVFSNTYDASVSLAYQACVLSAEQTYIDDFQVPNGGTVTINVQFSAVDEGRNGDLASNEFYVVPVTYSALSGALQSHADDAYADAGAAALPATNPAGGSDWTLPISYARFLGLSSSSAPFDDAVTLNTAYNWSFGQDVTDTIEHELSEGGLGRIGGLGDQNGIFSTMDLFRYTSAGAPDYTDGRDKQATFFSYDGGLDLSTLSFNNEFSGSVFENGGDTADFSQQDVFGTGLPGETNPLSPTDFETMYVLGWAPAATYTVGAGETGNGTVISGGQAQYVLAGGTTSGTVVRPAGNQIVSSGGTDSGAVLSGGGQLVLGAATGVTINSGGLQVVGSGGRASTTLIGSGGLELITAGGVATGTTVSSGGAVRDSGTLFVTAGGAARGVAVAAGGVEYVTVGAVDSAAIVSSGGDQIVFGSAARVSLSGFQDVHTAASGTSVLNGGEEMVWATGAATGSVIASGGLEYVATSGVDSGATVSGGGDQIVFGSALGAVLSGGLQEVHTAASGTTVLSGGETIVSATGIATSGVIASGGVEYVATSGIDSGATVAFGGEQVVFGGTLGAVLSGGLQEVHTVARDTTVSSGGRQLVENTGVAYRTTISSGGRETVSSGGAASGVTISGGTLEIAHGGTVDMAGFAGGGILVLDDATQFSGRISGFAVPGQIDLANIAFHSATTSLTWTQATGSGTLQVSDGSNLASLVLIGTYTSGQFHIQSDGASGTLVTDPPVAVAGFDFGDVAAPDAVPSNTAMPPAAPTPTPSGNSLAITSPDPLLTASLNGSSHAGRSA